MPFPSIIAFDGPAASGKTTLGKMLADELGYLFFDTGMMYRALTWLALQQGTPLEDEAALAELVEQYDFDVRPASQDDGRSADIWVAGKDITWEIRSPKVEANVSQVSAHPRVRGALTQQQRRIGQRGRVVMVGRDIGTVVLPEADLKIYLDASVEERARRRYQELVERGEHPNLEEILEGMRRRDWIDSTRDVAPLRPAEDAILLNSEGLSIEQVLEKIKKLFDPVS